jgi:hypothetical protein
MFAVDGTLAPASGPSTSRDPEVSFFGRGAGCAHKRAGSSARPRARARSLSRCYVSARQAFVDGVERSRDAK